MRFHSDFSGRVRYLTDVQQDQLSLLVAVPCQVGTGEPILSLLDTASEWCVLAWPAAERCGCVGDPDHLPTRFHTRFGLITGWLARLPVRFLAQEGEPLDLEATWFVSPDRPGPTVLGWRGCLERFRFTLAPVQQWFYFADLAMDEPYG